MKSRIIRLILSCAIAATCVLTSGAAPVTEADREGPAAFTADVPMRDGKTLPAFIILPAKTGSYPIILIYTAYGARVYQSAILASTNEKDVFFGPTARTIFGYVCVNTRGRNESRDAYYEGSPTVGDDGADVVKWIASQPWSSGKIGMYGSSADGTNQFHTAAEHPQNLTAIAPQVAKLGESYFQWFPGGVLEEAYLRTGGALWPGMLEAAIARPQMDVWWEARMSGGLEPTDVQVPAMLITGWWDHNLDIVFDVYEDIRTQGASGDKTKFVIGPWSHYYVGKLQQGDLQYPDAVEKNKAYLRRFYDYWLRGIDDGIYDEPPIYYYQLGEEAWKSASTWPPPGTSQSKYYLSATGRLLPTAPAEESGGSRGYVYDPNNPSPAVGGQFIAPSSTLYPDLVIGPAYQDNDVIACRDDYLVYDTPMLTEDLEVAGSPRARLYIECDRPDTDIIIRLCDFDPEGPSGKKTLLITTAPLRLRYRASWTDPSWMEPGKVYEVDIELDTLGYTWKKGHRARFIVSSSAHPLYAVNPNNKDHFIWDDGEPLVAKIRVWSNSSYPSHLTLPNRE
jgi:predicted acyl esterase